MISQLVFIEKTLTPKKYLGKLHCHDSDCFLMRRRELSSKNGNKFHPLANVVKFYSGLIGLRGKDSIVISEKPSDFVENKYGKLIPSGRYLQRYKVTFNGEYIRRDKKLYKSGYDEKKYLSPKIFLNQTGDSLKACYDNEGYFCLNNMHIGYSVDPIYDLRFVNAILCSKLMNFYYHAISLEFGRAMA